MIVNTDKYDHAKYMYGIKKADQNDTYTSVTTEGDEYPSFTWNSSLL